LIGVTTWYSSTAASLQQRPKVELKRQILGTISEVALVSAFVPLSSTIRPVTHTFPAAPRTVDNFRFAYFYRFNRCGISDNNFYGARIHYRVPAGIP